MSSHRQQQNMQDHHRASPSSSTPSPSSSSAMSPSQRNRSRHYEQEPRDEQEARHYARSRRNRRERAEEQREEEEEQREDPYNRRQLSTPDQLVEHHYYLADAMDEQQLAYDSMSTILEVDSEGSELSERRLDSPLQVRTSRSPQPDAGAQANQRRPNRRPSPDRDQVSPVSEELAHERFSGTLNALAAQVERLRGQRREEKKSASLRPSSAQSDTATSSSKSSESATTSESSTTTTGANARNEQQQQHHAQADDAVHTSASGSLASSARQTPSIFEPTEAEEEEQEDSERMPTKRAAAAETPASARPKSRANSADSLMMITLSPMGSPRIRLPLAGQRNQQLVDQVTGERKVVEVSNKSTTTAIDLQLMDKMVRKYFVDMRDKATQSIDFDYNEGRDEDNGVKDRTSGDKLRAQTRRPVTKNVAVGTEKFSRERFSLLPPTKTRSTQTKANMDNDIGVSETRRFKLGSLGEFGPIIRGKSAPMRQQQQQQGENDDDDDRQAQVPSGADRVQTPTQTRDSSTDPISLESQAMEDSLIAPVPPGASKLTERRQARERKVMIGSGSAKEERDAEAGRPEVAAAAAAAAPASETGSDSLESAGSGRDSSRADSPGTAAASKTGERGRAEAKVEGERGQDGGEQSSKRELAAPNSRALIPSVKTELRVIIEIQDSSKQQRHRSQLHSESQIIDGKLSKRTQVSTSKETRAGPKSPRQVLQSLQAAGRQHSLLYAPLDGLNGVHQGPGASNSINISAGPRSSPFSGRQAPVAVMAANEQALRSANSMSSLASGEQKGRWHEISKSTVCNELEADVNNGKRKRKFASGEQQHGELVLSTSAEINHFGANDDGKSAINLRSKAAERKRNSTAPRDDERVLVETEARFDERDLGQGQAQLHRQQQQQHQRAPIARPAQVGAGAAPSPVRDGSELIRRVEEQEERARERVRQAPAIGLLRPGGRAASNLHLNSPGRPRETQQPPVSSSVPNIPAAGGYQQRAHLEVEEESEDRRQVSRNGRLVYDDRLRERRFETRTNSPNINAPASPAPSPTLNGILKNSQQQQQAKLLKPISLQTPASPSNHMMMASPPILFADQTSNLSASDPETMDSGFAQSGAGSSNILNRDSTASRLAKANFMQPASSPAAARKANQRSQLQSSASNYDLLDNDSSNSLTFVDDDDDVDELIDQLGGSRMLSPQPARGQQRSRQSPPVIPGAPGGRLGAPLAALRASEPTALNRLGLEAGPTQRAGVARRPGPAPLASLEPMATTDTELTTKLTRSRPKESAGPQRDLGAAQSSGTGRRARTKTQLEQSLVVPQRSDPDQAEAAPTSRQPQCRFWSQVMFESDTDSAADRQSVSSSQSANRSLASRPLGPRANRKELVSETRYTLTSDGRGDTRNSRDLGETVSSAEVGQGGGQVSASGASHPTNWDYSLRVNRTRGDKVDSKVSTYIKHSRQPVSAKAS